MALVVITLCDDPDGSIDISAKSEPFLPGPESETPMTPAQSAAFIALVTIAEAMQPNEDASESQEG